MSDPTKKLIAYQYQIRVDGEPTEGTLYGPQRMSEAYVELAKKYPGTLNYDLVRAVQPWKK